MDNGPQFAQATVLITALIESGVRQFFICPGNQSSTLAAALAMHPEIGIEYHFDERAVAFMALGYGRATERPAAVVCTSGSAVANLLPAVVEADASQIPLILLTADRPEELQEVGANQTIRQTGFFSQFVRWHFDFAAPDGDNSTTSLPSQLTATAKALEASRVSAASYATYKAQQHPAGPVHLNIRFRKPFFVHHQHDASASASQVADEGSRPEPTHYAITQLSLPETELRRIARRLQSAKRGFIAVGALSRNSDRQAIEALAAHLGWPLWASVLSGFRRPGFSGLSCSHWYLSAEEFACRHLPDVVLQLGDEPPKPGNAVVRFLEASGATRIYVSELDKRIDPSHSLTERVVVDPSWFAARITSYLRPAPSTLQEPLMHAETLTREVLHAYDSDDEISELRVVRTVFRSLTAEQELFLGNSLAVRLAEFAALDGSPELIYNRGVSGIDGSIATAAGACVATGKPTFAILGDLTALYDINSLAFVARRKLPLTIIILNNDGGGIFAMIPQPMLGEDALHRYSDYMYTPHGLDFAELTRGMGLGYRQPQTMREFREELETSIRQKKPLVIEILVTAAATVGNIGDLLAQVAEQVASTSSVDL